MKYTFKNKKDLSEFVKQTIKDLSTELGLKQGEIKHEFVNVDEHKKNGYDISPISTYDKTIILIDEDLLNFCNDPVSIYFEVVKEIRYIFQYLCVNLIVQNEIYYDNLSLIEGWIFERECNDFDDHNIRKIDTLKCNEDATNYSVNKTLKFSIKYYAELLP